MRSLILALLLGLTPAVAASAAETVTPADVGVRVEKPAGDGVHFSQGSGVFLGDGLVLTAAHVVNVDPAHTKTTVVMDGWRIDGTLVYTGLAQKVDLALIRIGDASLSPKRQAQPQVAVCDDNPPPSQPVLVAALDKLTISSTVGTAITSDGQTTGSWTNLLGTGYHNGASGGGVFKPQVGCLWGILNLELSGPSKTPGQKLDLTAFVPASKITPFLQAYREHGGDTTTAP